MSKIFVIGHKNPDTDSIASAVAYSRLKNIVDTQNEYIPARCGNANSQTRFIFNRVGCSLPKLVKDVYVKTADVMTSELITVMEDEPVYDLLTLLHKHNLRIIPVLSSNGSYIGVAGAFELLKLSIQLDVDERPQYSFNAASIARAVKGSVAKKGDNGIITGAIMVGAMPCDELLRHIDMAGSKNTILVVGNRPEIIRNAVKSGVAAIVVTGVKNMNAISGYFTDYSGWVYISNLDSAETVRRLVLAVPVKYVMNKKYVTLTGQDYLETAKDIITNTDQRAIPILDGDKPVGIITRGNIIKRYRSKLILVDHNEADQAVDGVEVAEVLEIIDHHRLGAVKTATPVTFYAKPVGSTCTLVYQLYKNAGVQPDKQTSLILMSGILSDTVMLKSPTATDDDRVALADLEVLAGVSYKDFGLEIFSSTDSLSSRTPENIVTTDFKKYTENNVSVGVGQVEVVTLGNLDEVKERLFSELESQKTARNLNWAMLLITDIINEESILLSTYFPGGEKLLSYKEIEPHLFYLPNVLSRKKQLLPEILRVLEEL